MPDWKKPRPLGLIDNSGIIKYWQLMAHVVIDIYMSSHLLPPRSTQIGRIHVAGHSAAAPEHCKAAIDPWQPHRAQLLLNAADTLLIPEWLLMNTVLLNMCMGNIFNVCLSECTRGHHIAPTCETTGGAAPQGPLAQLFDTEKLLLIPESHATRHFYWTLHSCCQTLTTITGNMLPKCPMALN